LSLDHVVAGRRVDRVLATVQFDYHVQRLDLVLFFLDFFFFQAEDGIRDRNVTGVQRVLFRSCVRWPRSPAPGPAPAAWGCPTGWSATSRVRSAAGATAPWPAPSRPSLVPITKSRALAVTPAGPSSGWGWASAVPSGPAEPHWIQRAP